MNASIDQVLKTDVLVLGGGAAGLRAAIEASRKGVEACILSTFKTGLSNNTAISLGGFSAAGSPLDRTDSPRQHYEDTVLGGCGLNRTFLARLLTENVWAEVEALEAMGVGFLKDADGKHVRVARGGHSRARRLATPKHSGMNFMTPLIKYMKKMNIKELGGLKAVSLLTSEKRVCGALLLDRDGALSAIDAKAVVLATGGGGAVYPRTTNVPTAIGDGYALAYRVGLTIQDMEFVQFVVRKLKQPGTPKRIPPTESLLLKGAVLRNPRGEDLFEALGIPRAFTRDAIAQVVARGIRSPDNPNDFVYLDVKNLDKDEISGLSLPPGQMMMVFPASHFFMGGVRVDKDLTTPVKGLFVAGEVMGGVHGANRLAGNALAETFVFGALIGSRAAEFVEGDGPASAFQPALARRAADEMFDRFGKAGRDSASDSRLSEIDSRLKNILGISGGIIRDGDAIEQGIRDLEDLREEFLSLTLSDSPNLWKTTAIENKFLVCEMILKSALKREESRGAHFREDCPERDDTRFGVNVCVGQGRAGQMDVSTQPVGDDKK